MNKKGQSAGLLLLIAVSVIVCLVLFQAIAGNTDVPTKTANLVNGTYTLGASGSCQDLVGQELLSSPIVLNATNNVIITGKNTTISERVSAVDGLKRIGICSTGSSINSEDIDGYPIKVSYTYGREGYIEDSAGRSIVGIIVLLTALGIALIAFIGVRRDY